MYLQIGHRKLHYKWINKKADFENNPVIIFLHEGLGSINQWKDFPEMLCNLTDLQGFIYEREGYGKSGFWEKTIPEDYLEIEGQDILPKIIDESGIREYFLFGHSDGATINLYHASNQPANLIGMIVEAPHVIIEDKTVNALLQVKNNLDNSFIERLDKYQYGRAQELVNHWTNYWMRPKFSNWNMISTLKTITTHTLLIQGFNDTFGSFKQLDIIKENSNSQIEELRLQNCGHIPHLEFKEEVLVRTKDFLLSLTKK